VEQHPGKHPPPVANWTVTFRSLAPRRLTVNLASVVPLLPSLTDASVIESVGND